MRNKILFGLLALLAISALLLFFGSDNHETNNYVNRTYGFEISYPKNLTPETAFDSYYHLSSFWRAEAGPDSTGTPVVAIPVYRIHQGGVATGKPYPLYFDAEVRVGVSNNPADIANCLKPDPGYASQKVTNVNINGLTFEKFDFQSAGMMQYLQGESYRIIHNNLCFAIEQIKTGSSYRDPSMLPGTPDSVLNGYYDETGQIIKSFRFIN